MPAHNVIELGESSDGRLLLLTESLGRNNLLQVWDPITGDEKISAIGLNNPYWKATFGTSVGDTSLLAVADGDSVYVIDAETGLRFGNSFVANADEVAGLGIGRGAEGGAVIAFASNDGDAIIWDVITGIELGNLQLASFGLSGLIAVSAGPDGEPLIATATSGDTINLWDRTNCQTPKRRLIGHTGRIVALSFRANDDGQVVLHVWSATIKQCGFGTRRQVDVLCLSRAALRSLLLAAAVLICNPRCRGCIGNANVASLKLFWNNFGSRPSATRVDHCCHRIREGKSLGVPSGDQMTSGRCIPTDSRD